MVEHKGRHNPVKRPGFKADGLDRPLPQFDVDPSAFKSSPRGVKDRRIWIKTDEGQPRSSLCDENGELPATASDVEDGHVVIDPGPTKELAQGRARQPADHRAERSEHGETERWHEGLLAMMDMCTVTEHNVQDR